MTDSPKVFICYMRQDGATAERLFDYLDAAGADPWLDKRKLVQGDLWEEEIRAAVRASDAFVACLRPGFEGRGFRQKEVRWALDAMNELPPGRGFVIPFLVEACELPGWSAPIHAGTDLNRPTQFEEVLRAVNKHCAVNLQPSTNPKRFNDRQKGGVRGLLSDSLSVTPRDEIVVICDENTRATAECISTVAKEEVSAKCMICEISASRQDELGMNLPDGLRKLLSSSTCLIVLSGVGPRAASFRLATLEIASKSGARCASMPGMTLSHLHMCGVVSSVLRDRTNMLVSLAVSSHRGLIETRSSSGENHILEFGLSDVAPKGLADPIPAGGWGNVPSGEVFLAPEPGSAEGSFVVSGSIPGRLLSHDEELILSFRRGRVMPPKTSSQEIASVVRELLYTGQKEISHNCTQFSELGIGTNHAIRELFGLPALDEKGIGTVHIGLGRNTQFGGTITSALHSDWLTFPVALLFDDTRVISGREFVLR